MKHIINTLIVYITLSSILYFEIVETWDLLNTIGLNTTEIPIKHITIFKNKAYLSIPQIKDNQNVTFVEASWPESLQSDSSKVNALKIFSKDKTQVIIIICIHNTS